MEPQAPPSDSPAIYDSIAVTYASYKNASEFKRFSEEPTFWAALGDPKGLVILDLACGTGHYSRNMHLKGPLLDFLLMDLPFATHRQMYNPRVCRG